MRKFLMCTLASAILAVGLLIGCGEKTEVPKTIDYQVLRQWNIPAGGIGMEILVSENATKEKVLALASSLRSKYLSGGFIFIDIFDLREAWEWRIQTIDALKYRPFDPIYPPEWYSKHFLVSITRNPTTGYDEILWVAEGRGY